MSETTPPFDSTVRVTAPRCIFKGCVGVVKDDMGEDAPRGRRVGLRFPDDSPSNPYYWYFTPGELQPVPPGTVGKPIPPRAR